MIRSYSAEGLARLAILYVVHPQLDFLRPVHQELYCGARFCQNGCWSAAYVGETLKIFDGPEQSTAKSWRSVGEKHLDKAKVIALACGTCLLFFRLGRRILQKRSPLDHIKTILSESNF